MKVALRPPCAECPFLKSCVKGWLGADTPQQVWLQVHNENEFGYPCHMDAAKVTAEKGDLQDPNSTEQCAGALLHASKTFKNYTNPDRREGASRLAKMFPKLLNLILGFEFVEHHTI